MDGKRRAPLALSASQNTFWLLDEIGSATNSGVLGFRLRVDGPLRLDRLRAAYGRIATLHPTLQTRFSSAGHPITQSPGEGVAPAYSEFAQEVDDDEHSTDIARNELYEVDLDIFRDPLLSLLVVRRGGDRFDLYFRTHHIVCDGRSFTILLNTFAELYRDQSSDLVSDAPVNDRSHREHRDAPSDRRGSGDGGLADRWRKTLSDAPHFCNLPLDRGSIGSLASPSRALRATLSPALVRALRLKSEETDWSRYTILLAAFYKIVSDLCQEETVLIGVPHHGRGAADHPDSIGCFVNTLPVRCQVDLTSDIDRALSAIGSQLRGAIDIAAMPFDEIISIIQPERDPHRSTLIQATCNFLKVDTRAWDALGFECDFEQVHRTPTQYDLSLGIEEAGSNIRVYLSYLADRMSGDQAGRILRHWERCVETICTSRSSDLFRRISYMSSDERRDVIAVSRGEEHLPRETSFASLLAQSFERHAQSVALIHDGVEITYSDLDGISRRLANSLRKAGGGRRSTIAIMMPENANSVISQVSVVRCGAAFVPLDPDWPSDRIRSIMDEITGPVITDAQTLADHPYLEDRCVLIESASSESDRFDQPETDASDPLYVIYTSGTTGVPKGVINTQKGVLNRLDWMTREVGAAAARRSLKNIRQTFDSSVWQVFWPLLHGGAVIVLDVRKTAPVEFFRLIRHYGITIADFVPSLFAQFSLDLAGRDGDGLFPESRSCFPDLAVVIFGGEEIGRAGVDWFLRRSPCRVFNLYGPTEASISCIFHEMREKEEGNVPIGRPIDNMSAYILSGDLDLLPCDVPGELCLAGVGVATGYLNRPDLTRRVFIDDPIAGAGRMYRTGDMAKRSPNGEIIFLGRVDKQIKFNGVRIELSSIEALIRKQVESDGALVLPRRLENGREVLVAYIVGCRDESYTIATMRAGLLKSLPSMMVPTSLIHLERLPLVGGGKLNVDLLPLPSIENAQPATDRLSMSPVESRVANIWIELLGPQEISRDSDFFSQGGHSLLAVRMITRFEEEFSVRLRLRDVFATPTVRQISSVLAARAINTTNGSVSTRGSAVDAPTPVRLSPAQKQLLLAAKMQGDSSAYNMSYIVRLRGDLNLIALNLAFSELTRRHSALRMEIVELGTDWAQRVKPFRPTLMDPIAVHSEGIRTSIDEFINEPVLASSGNLFRTRLFKVKDGDHILALSMHHIVSDGWSLSIIHNDLVRIYNSCLSGSPSGLSDRPPQFIDYAASLQSRLSHDGMARQLSYWKTALEGIPHYLDLPGKPALPQSPSMKASGMRFAVPRDVHGAIKRLVTDYDATTFRVLLSTLEICLAKISGQGKFVVGTLNAGRGGAAELDRIVGFFVKMVPYVVDLYATMTFADVLSATSQQAFEAEENLDVTLDSIIGELKPVRHLFRQPLYQVLFSVQNAPRSTAEFLDIEIEQIEESRKDAKLDLSLFVSDEQDRMVIDVEYVDDLFDRDQIRLIVERWLLVIKNVEEHRDANPMAMSVVLDEELGSVTRYAGSVKPSSHRFQHLSEILGFWNSRSPDGVALTDGGESYTYRQLDAMVRALSNRLVQHEVKPRDVVGIYVGRSAHFITAVLAIVAIDATYLPLDPTLPASRITYMLQDSSARAVLSVPPVLSDSSLDGFDVLDILAPTPPQGQATTTPEHLSPASPAYIIYTSGSTGRPKGVVVSHGSVLSLLLSAETLFDFSQRDVWCLYHTPTFDFSVWEMWGCMHCGGRLVIVPFEVSRSPDDLALLVEKERISVLNQTPSAFSVNSRAMLGLPSPLSSLRYIIFGGETLSFSALKPWVDAYEDDRPKLVNMYGITETTVHVSFRRITTSDVRFEERNLIGLPLPHLGLVLLDSSLSLVPPGTVGEIFVSGEGLAMEYKNLPDLTSQRFPVVGQAGHQRMYRSGDLARWRADGELEFLGRADRQVKLSGFRIELSEVERALLSIPEISQVHVSLSCLGDTPILEAFIVRSEDVSNRYIHSTLQRTLPKYMIPSRLIPVPSISLTSNGKADLDTMRHRSAVVAKPEASFQEDSVVALVAGSFRKVLELGEVDADDNFFELGGHSLLLIRLCEVLRSDHGMTLSVFDVLSNPTPRGIANVGTSRNADPSEDHTILLRDGDDNLVTFMPTAYGSGTLFSDMARRLDTRSKIMSLRLKGVRQGEAMHPSVNEAAEHCLSQMRNITEGQINAVVGWSFGGVLAQEVACQMVEQGLKAPRLILIDSFRYKSAAVAGIDETEADEAWRRHAVFGDDTIVDPRRVFEHSIDILSAHVSRHYPGEIIDVLSQQTADRRAANPEIYHLLPAAQRKIVVIPGDHFSILSQDRSLLKDALDRHLEDGQ
jgi:amino acid adenylation domain-containing protein